MEQVGKVKFMYKFIIFVILIVFTGCAPKEEYIYKKIYKGYSKDAVLEASKKVFSLADKDKQFKIDSYRNKVLVSKVKFYNHFIDVGVVLDKWEIEVVQDGKQVRTLLNFNRYDLVDEDKKFEIHKNTNIKLFWNRLEYLLGMNDNWDNCTDDLTLFTNDSILCDMGVLFPSSPTQADLIRNPLLKQRPKRLYTIDTIDADIYKFTDLSINKKEDDIFLQEDGINNGEVLDPVLDNTILEIEAKKQEVKVKKDNKTNKEEPKEKTSKKEQAEKDLQKLKEEMSKILDSKENLDDSKIDEILNSEEEIIDNSKFILEKEKVK